MPTHTLIMNSITHKKKNNKKKKPTLDLIKVNKISFCSSINTIWYFPPAIEL